MTKRIGLWALVAGVALVLPATSALPEAMPAVPLKAGERVGLTATGCGLIESVSPDPASIAAFRQAVRARHWSGPCRNGLAHGQGVLTFPAEGQYQSAFGFQVELFYGRSRFLFTPSTGVESFMVDGQFFSMSQGTDFDRPAWWIQSDIAAGRRPSSVGVGYDSVSTNATDCMGYAECGPRYAIFAPRPGGGLGDPYYCPDKYSANGCEGLWHQLAGPFIAKYREGRAKYDAQAPAWRAELTQMNAVRDARYAALDVASGEAFNRSQAAAQADAAKTDRDFTAQLAGANAGRLFTMADEFEGAGDIEKARQTLRTLINRFPDHGLAVTAAQRLTALPAGPGAASGGECAAPAQEAQLGQALRGAMGRIPASNAVGKYEAVLATIERVGAAWSRCPSHPSSPAKLATYRSAFVETARRCAMISPTGPCTPRMP